MGYDMSWRRIDDAAETADPAESSYFHLNIFGMGRYCNVMYRVGMLFQDEPHPKWPRVEEFDVTHDQLTAVQHPDEYPDELAALDDDARKKVDAYLRAVNDILAWHSRETPGIPAHKFSTNDGWIVLPAEALAAVKIWRQFCEDKGRESAHAFVQAHIKDGELAITREALRLAKLFNGSWSHHLNDEDVAALVEAERLHDFTHTWIKGSGWVKKDPPVVPTAEQVNEWSLRGFGHDSINAVVVVRARCERDGMNDTCQTCDGHSTLEAYEGQRAEAEAWESTPPPSGDGWQLWETTSEGSPTSPVFSTADELAIWMSTHPSGFAGSTPSLEAARAFVAQGWAPSLMATGGRVLDGVSAAHTLDTAEAGA